MLQRATVALEVIAGSGGKGLVVGPAASKQELDELRTRLIADPRGWIAQPVVMLSTIPTLVEDGMRPRHADLRPFAVNDGNDVWVLPGGLTRVALPEGSLVVNSSQGGGSKDTWVLASRTSGADRELAGDEVVRALPTSGKSGSAKAAKTAPKAANKNGKAESSDNSNQQQQQQQNQLRQQQQQ